MEPSRSYCTHSSTLPTSWCPRLWRKRSRGSTRWSQGRRYAHGTRSKRRRGAPGSGQRYLSGLRSLLSKTGLGAGLTRGTERGPWGHQRCPEDPGPLSPASPQDVSPGPIYFLDPKVTRFGRSCTPAYSMQGRGKSRGEYLISAVPQGPHPFRTTPASVLSFPSQHQVLRTSMSLE